MTLFRLIAAALASLAPLAADDGASFSPNEPDEHTLHLWHLDEAHPPFRNAARPPFPMQGLLNGATAGHRSLPGLGKALSFHADAGGAPGKSSLRGAVLLAAPALAMGKGDNIPSDFRYFGDEGAFTIDLLVKLDLKPEDAQVIALGLVSMDGDNIDSAMVDVDRIFNFRIEKEGFLSFIPLPNGGATGGGIATIPRSGPHALDTESWFHVAVTYDGNAGATNNLKLYWTRIAAGLKEANLIGSGTLSADLNGATGDFAIGNEARSFPGNAEGEPFPGLIDEVRISGVARHPSDFFFVPRELRKAPGRSPAGGEEAPHETLSLQLAGIQVNSLPIPLPGPRAPLRLGSGLHRLDFDFDFGVHPGLADDSLKLRCQLEGLDERWQKIERGMSLAFQCLNGDGTILSQAEFRLSGRSSGWQTSLEDSPRTPRQEPVFIPAGAVEWRVVFGSGSPDTTGFAAIDNLRLIDPADPSVSLWLDGDFESGENVDSPAGVPKGWKRGGTDPAIARFVVTGSIPRERSLGLTDGDQRHHGEWSAAQRIPRLGGHTLVLSWEEAHNVIGGPLHRATYVNVPPGRYTFRAIGLAGNHAAGSGISQAVVIDPPFWRRLWFWPTVSTASVGLIAAALFLRHRRKVRRRLEALRYQNALEQDRTRIARDLHDDLGTRVTVINMTAALAQRDLETQPEKARRHLSKMTGAARDLVTAMDDLVWAVDPAHDTLDHLASHITRLAEEISRNSSVRCRLDIPAILPARPLGSEARHHIALSVKEALHNILRHAGPCEVFLSLSFDGGSLRIDIRDTGAGFDPAACSEGRGLGNLVSRLREIGGDCSIGSSAGGGSHVTLTCPLPGRPR